RGGGACPPRSSASPRRPYSSGTGRPAGRPREEYAMSRLKHVTDTGGRRGLRLLLMLRHDLLTLRADPMPPSAWLRWVPHGLACLTALALLLGEVNQLQGEAKNATGASLWIAAGLC